ncbi:hypothetical protein [Bradyrhizobium sp. JYMT SZCCT0428]|uniref:hypothetical protein n=1 Tax=Bradyrhizobium sp. JYMT SZCCT0428 TaxID=2807673 RepID=UPI001BAB02B8|nr:hypothetical protein [Bradyrhizobium sp. JYMT SZCCT0428]MBR1156302.1 hypothetical protein [Bradyrhizobium sp. JYMT SZCCT0428]
MTDIARENTFTRYAATFMMKRYLQSLEARGLQSLIFPNTLDDDLYSVFLTDLIEVAYAIDVRDNPEQHHEPCTSERHSGCTSERDAEFGNALCEELKSSLLSPRARFILDDSNCRRERKQRRSGNRGRLAIAAHEISIHELRLLQAVEEVEQKINIAGKQCIPTIAQHRGIEVERLRKAVNGRNGHVQFLFTKISNLSCMN